MTSIPFQSGVSLETEELLLVIFRNGLEKLAASLGRYVFSLGVPVSAVKMIKTAQRIRILKDQKVSN